MARRLISLTIAVAGLAALSLPAPGFAGATDCRNPADAEYGSHACKVARLRERPFVVVAAVDTGINPYHIDFRLPPGDDRIGVHPSEYIEGFPSDAAALNLSFGASTPAEGQAQDASEWAKLSPGKPVWMPGTNLLGATPTQGGTFLDTTNGHGTGVASVVGGLKYGRGTPNVIVLAMSGYSASWRWAANQPWVDLITISWSELIPLLDESAEASHEAAASGKISCAATGNLTVPIVFLEAQGPASTVHVGAVDPDTRQIKDYSGFPADVLGVTDLPAASHNTLDGERSFGGTSAATPHVCALFARAISMARERVGDFREGPHDGGLIAGPTGTGALADGVITRLELEDAVEATAIPVSSSQEHFVRGGYGLAEWATIDEALKVLFGEKPRPSRQTEDLWQQAIDTGRDAIWDHVPECPAC